LPSSNKRLLNSYLRKQEVVGLHLGKARRTGKAKERMGKAKERTVRARGRRTLTLPNGDRFQVPAHLRIRIFLADMELGA